MTRSFHSPPIRYAGEGVDANEITPLARRARQYYSASIKALLFSALLAVGICTAQAEVLEGRVVGNRTIPLEGVAVRLWPKTDIGEYPVWVG